MCKSDRTPPEVLGLSLVTKPCLPPSGAYWSLLRSRWFKGLRWQGTRLLVVHIRDHLSWTHLSTSFPLPPSARCSRWPISGESIGQPQVKSLGSFQIFSGTSRSSQASGTGSHGDPLLSPETYQGSPTWLCWRLTKPETSPNEPQVILLVAVKPNIGHRS